MTFARRAAREARAPCLSEARENDLSRCGTTHDRQAWNQNNSKDRGAERANERQRFTIRSQHVPPPKDGIIGRALRTIPCAVRLGGRTVHRIRARAVAGRDRRVCGGTIGAACRRKSCSWQVGEATSKESSVPSEDTTTSELNEVIAAVADLDHHSFERLSCITTGPPTWNAGRERAVAL